MTYHEWMDRVRRCKAAQPVLDLQETGRTAEVRDDGSVAFGKTAGVSLVFTSHEAIKIRDWLNEVFIGMDMPPRITYWLYDGDEPLTAVRLPEGADDLSVKGFALRQLEVVPGVICPFGVTPAEMGARIKRAKVRVYEDGR